MFEILVINLTNGGYGYWLWRKAASCRLNLISRRIIYLQPLPVFASGFQRIISHLVGSSWPMQWGILSLFTALSDEGNMLCPPPIIYPFPETNLRECGASCRSALAFSSPCASNSKESDGNSHKNDSCQQQMVNSDSHQNECCRVEKATIFGSNKPSRPSQCDDRVRRWQKYQKLDAVARHGF